MEIMTRSRTSWYAVRSLALGEVFRAGVEMLTMKPTFAESAVKMLKLSVGYCIDSFDSIV